MPKPSTFAKPVEGPLMQKRKGSLDISDVSSDEDVPSPEPKKKPLKFRFKRQPKVLRITDDEYVMTERTQTQDDAPELQETVVNDDFQAPEPRETVVNDVETRKIAVNNDATPAVADVFAKDDMENRPALINTPNPAAALMFVLNKEQKLADARNAIMIELAKKL